MGDVIDLPSRAQQGMAFLEQEIRKMMSEKGESDTAIELALETLKDVYTRYGDIGKLGFEIKLPSSLTQEQSADIYQQIDHGLHILIEEHSHIINRLAAELVMTKLKLFEEQEKNT